MISGPARGCSDIVTYLGPWFAYCYDQTSNLGVVFDPELKFDKHFFQIRSLARLKPILSITDLEKVINA